MVDESGFQVTFDRPVNTGLLSLYDGIIEGPGVNNSLGAPDLTLVGASTGPVHGSMVWNAATNTATFVASSVFNTLTKQWTKINGPLPVDNYTVTLVSPAAPPAISGTVASSPAPTTTTFTPAGIIGTIPSGGYMLIGGTSEHFVWNNLTSVFTLSPACPARRSAGRHGASSPRGWHTAAEQPLNGAYGANYTHDSP